MNVGFRINSDWMEFGDSEVLYSFFSTICYRLEDNEWGSKYPVVMNGLYFNEETGVRFEEVDTFRSELSGIQEAFLALKPKDAIWSCEDMGLAIPNDAPNLASQADNLVHFYQSKYGKGIFDILNEVIECMEYYKTNCTIVSERKFDSQ